MTPSLVTVYEKRAGVYTAFIFLYHNSEKIAIGKSEKFQGAGGAFSSIICYNYYNLLLTKIIIYAKMLAIKDT